MLEYFLKNEDNLPEICFGFEDSKCYAEKLKVTLKTITDCQLTGPQSLIRAKCDRDLFCDCQTFVSSLNEVDKLTIMLKQFKVLKTVLGRIKTYLDLAYELFRDDEPDWLKEPGQSRAALNAEIRTRSSVVQAEELLKKTKSTLDELKKYLDTLLLPHKLSNTLLASTRCTLAEANKILQAIVSENNGPVKIIQESEEDSKSSNPA